MNKKNENGSNEDQLLGIVIMKRGKQIRCFAFCFFCSIFLFIAIIVTIVIGLGVIVLVLYLDYYNHKNAVCEVSIPDSLDYTDLFSKITRFYSKDFSGPSIRHIQIKGTRNSYKSKTGLLPINLMNYAHSNFSDQVSNGIRSFEFDIHYSRKTERWSVFHTVLDTSTYCSCLSDCLSIIKKSIPEKHHLIPIFIEPKYNYDEIFGATDSFCLEGDDGLFDIIDREIMAVFNASDLIIPKQIQGNYSNIREALEKRGFLNLEATTGKFMFIMHLFEENERCFSFYENKQNKLFFSGKPDYPEYRKDNYSFVFFNKGETSNIINQTHVTECISGHNKTMTPICYDEGNMIIVSDYIRTFKENGTICNLKTSINCTDVNIYLNSLK